MTGIVDNYRTIDNNRKILTFTNRMSNHTVLRDRKNSSKRVHIERLIGLAKTFKILKGPLNSTETKLARETLCLLHLVQFSKVHSS